MSVKSDLMPPRSQNLISDKRLEAISDLPLTNFDLAVGSKDLKLATTSYSEAGA